jgi:addiction module RelE/StbE family toxin
VTRRRIEYADRYFRRLEDIREYIEQQNPAAGARIVTRIRSAVEGLETMPEIGRPGRVAGTRELVIAGTPYIVPYRLQDDVLQIITILHSAQKWPDRFP